MVAVIQEQSFNDDSSNGGANVLESEHTEAPPTGDHGDGENHLERSNKILNGGQGRQQQQQEQVVLVDMALVARVRELLETEWLNMDDEQQEKYSKLHYEELMDSKSPFTCWRYLVDCNLKIDDTVESIKSSLIWRKLNGAEELMNELLIKEFWFHSPIFFCGLNKRGDHNIYVIGRHYRKPGCSKLRKIVKDFTTNILFNWDRQHRNDLERVSFVFDVAQTGYHNVDYDYIKWMLELRSVLPCRIADIYVSGIPYLMRPIVSLIISWMPQSLSKLVKCGGFEDLILENIELDNIPAEMGGTCPERLYRLAPIEAPWARETSLLNGQDNMLKNLKSSIWNYVTDERVQRIQAMQEEYENKDLKR